MLQQARELSFLLNFDYFLELFLDFRSVLNFNFTHTIFLGIIHPPKFFSILLKNRN